jgi:hypothetical protein
MKRELIEIGETIRVENGPARQTAVATEELLDDTVTASHYHVGMRDAMGKVIALGEPMTYLDYHGEWIWYIYQLQDDETAPDGKRWMAAGAETTKERALKAAELLEE